MEVVLDTKQFFWVCLLTTFLTAVIIICCIGYCCRIYCPYSDIESASSLEGDPKRVFSRLNSDGKEWNLSSTSEGIAGGGSIHSYTLNNLSPVHCDDCQGKYVEKQEIKESIPVVDKHEASDVGHDVSPAHSQTELSL